VAISKSDQSTEKEISFAAALLGLIYTSIKHFYLDLFGSRWEYLMWTSVATALVILVAPVSLLAILFPKLTHYLIVTQTIALSVGLLIYLIYLYFLLGNNERLREWTHAGKQRFKLLDRYGGYVAFSIIFYSLFLGPFFAIARLAGVPGTTP